MSAFSVSLSGPRALPKVPEAVAHAAANTEDHEVVLYLQVEWSSGLEQVARWECSDCDARSAS